MKVRSSNTTLPAPRGALSPIRPLLRQLCLTAIMGLSLLPLAAAASARVPSFQGLGDLPGGPFHSVALGVSADGSVVVGYSSSSAGGWEAFRWEGGVMTGLGDLPGGGFSSQATGVSADGSVVVGTGVAASGWHEGFRWQDGVMTGLGSLRTDAPSSKANGVSGDGSVVVGQSDSPVSLLAVRWQGGRIASLGYVPGFEVAFEAHGVSADGSVIVGEGRFWQGGARSSAFRWEGGVLTALGGDLTGGMSHSIVDGVHSIAYGVSADGSVVVGAAASIPRMRSVRWKDGVMMPLGHPIPQLDELFGSRAIAASADGSVIVGDAVFNGREAFLWTEASGKRSLRQVLVDDYGLGASLDGWQLVSATAISPDGLSFAGWGQGPRGHVEGWVATVPEPETWAMLAAGLGILGWAARRRRR